MDSDLPLLKCAQCGEDIAVGEPLTAIGEVDPDSGEPISVAKKVVHTDCFPAWEKEQGVTGS